MSTRIFIQVKIDYEDEMDESVSYKFFSSKEKALRAGTKIACERASEIKGIVSISGYNSQSTFCVMGDDNDLNLKIIINPIILDDDLNDLYIVKYRDFKREGSSRNKIIKGFSKAFDYQQEKLNGISEIYDRISEENAKACIEKDGKYRADAYEEEEKEIFDPEEGYVVLEQDWITGYAEITPITVL